jgi:hypothetical protein
LLQPAGARRHNGKFRHRQNAVEHNQQQDQRNV